MHQRRNYRYGSRTPPIVTPKPHPVSIPREEFRKLTGHIKTGLAKPNNPAATFLAKESLETLTHYAT